MPDIASSTDPLNTAENRARDAGPDRLTRARIVDAAVAIARRDGLDALSMRRLAQEMGVSTMAAYRHVDGKEQLVDATIDAVVATVELPDLDDDGDWGAQLEELTIAVHRSLVDFPGIAEYLQGRVIAMPGIAALVGTIAKLVGRARTEPVVTSTAVTAIVWHLRGAARLEQERDQTQAALRAATQCDVTSEALGLRAAEAGATLEDVSTEDMLRGSVRLVVDGLRARSNAAA